MTDVDLDRYVGTYQGTRYGTTTIARLGKLTQRLEVAWDGNALAATWPRLTGRRRAGARTPGRLAVLVTTAAFLVMLGLFGTLVTDPMVLASQPRALLNALAVRGLIALVATAWTSLRTGKAWIHREGTARRRAVATLASGSVWTLIGVAAYWNVLGFAW